MTDAHCHRRENGNVRSFICAESVIDAVEGDVRFYGIHPWNVGTAADVETIEKLILNDADAGVGEIGLDRLRAKVISGEMREAFLAQLEFAAKHGRRVVLHGAKCWGEVVRELKPYAAKIPAMIFHGFSRSDGLIPEIRAMNGFISVGPQILNEHAVNYRVMVKKLPPEMILAETDRTEDGAAAIGIAEVMKGLAEVREVSLAEMERLTDANADRFLEKRI